MNVAAPIQPGHIPRFGWISLLIAAVLTTTVARAQIIGERIAAPAAAGPKTLPVRDSSFSSVTPKSESIYRKEPGSQTFVLDSTEGETRYEWNIGGQVRPLAEAPAKPAHSAERRVKFLAHQGKRFVKIEASAGGEPGSEPGQKEEKIQFSGVYEISTLEGDWAAYESGGTVKLRMLAGDHERYLKQVLSAFYGPAALAVQADKFRQSLLGILERKIAAPGDIPAAELETLRRIVDSTKTRPETIPVAVAPSLTSDPEIFVLEGETMRSITTDRSLVLRFKAAIRDPGPTAAPLAKP